MAGPSVMHLNPETGRGLVIAARIGYAARGLVYAVLGILAIMFVLGEGGQLTDNKGALERIGQQPLGTALLWITSAGLACYALWCAVRVVKDPDHARRPEQSLVRRAGFALGAFWYALLAMYAGQLARGAGAERGGDTKSIVAEAMRYPLGEIAVAVVGLVTVGFGARQVWKAYKNDVGAEFRGAVMTAKQRRFAQRVARVGTAARGAVFPVIGVSLIVAALRERPGEAQGFGEALRDLSARPLGDFLIGFVAVGLLAYGVYQLCVARYGRLPQPI